MNLCHVFVASSYNWRKFCELVNCGASFDIQLVNCGANFDTFFEKRGPFFMKRGQLLYCKYDTTQKKQKNAFVYSACNLYIVRRADVELREARSSILKAIIQKVVCCNTLCALA
eukprot:GEMP01076873.1.p1 GENE.GEMP01076873.1~~GEMP01076873.1.p1  ORF type:complete len:114 (-),score=3.43 GEMP01076873.1:343-684(-)